MGHLGNENIPLFAIIGIDPIITPHFKRQHCQQRETLLISAAFISQVSASTTPNPLDASYLTGDNYYSKSSLVLSSPPSYGRLQNLGKQDKFPGRFKEISPTIVSILHISLIGVGVTHPGRDLGVNYPEHYLPCSLSRD